MTIATLAALLPSLATNEETRADVSDWAVNTLRDWARANNFSQADILALVNEDFARIEAGNLDLHGYLRVTRRGSRFALDRVTRTALFAHWASRVAAGKR